MENIFPPSNTRTFLDGTAQALRAAADAARIAAAACKVWEDEGNEAAVAETAASAVQCGKIALEGVIVDEPWDGEPGDPETRRARLAYAGWLLLLAGTDEHGESGDLVLASALFEHAANA